MRGYEIKDLLLDNLQGLPDPLPPHPVILDFAHISRCPFRLYEDLTAQNGYLSTKAHWYSLLNGACQETLAQLLDVQKIGPIEVVSDIDPRFQGTVTYRLDGNPVLIVPVSWRTFRYVIANREAERCYFHQAQALLRHGGYSVCHCLYLARDVPEGYWQGIPVWIFDIWPHPEVADRLDEKAGRVLAAVDAGESLMCECGRC